MDIKTQFLGGQFSQFNVREPQFDHLPCFLPNMPTLQRTSTSKEIES